MKLNLRNKEVRTAFLKGFFTFGILSVVICACVIGVHFYKKIPEKENKTVDLILFSGQSNMSGFGGNKELAPELMEGAGFEFRAISDPTKLYPIEEPFGQYEITDSSFIDGSLREGTLVTSFANAYYTETQTPIVGVSISQGGSTINWWNMESHYEDAIDRFQDAQTYLIANGYTIRHKYMVWIHGENDGIEEMSTETYKADFYALFSHFFDAGIEKCMIVPTGDTLIKNVDYTLIQLADYEIVSESDQYILASLVLTDLGQNYLSDDAHYSQEALNKLGEDLGKNIAMYVKTGMKPVDKEQLKILIDTKIKENEQEKNTDNKTETETNTEQ